MIRHNAYVSLRDDENGATLVEFALVLALFLLLFFGLIDFGRLAYHYVTTEKAVQIAARIAAVRPAACAGVPLINGRPNPQTVTPPPRFGTSCRIAGACAAPAVVACRGDAANATASEVWTRVSGIMPNGAQISDLWFKYTYDSDLGFLGGPYVPIMTVELNGPEEDDPLPFQFVSPLGALAGLAMGTAATSLGADMPFPSMSVSLPAEDLASGDAG